MSDYSGQTFTGQDFSNLELSQSDFSGAVLTGCDLVNASLAESSFNEATVTGCDFTNSDLSQTDFSGSTLTGCDFTNCNLDYANFGDATVTGCDFTNVDVDNISGLEFLDEDSSGFIVSGGVSLHQSNGFSISNLGWVCVRSNQGISVTSSGGFQTIDGRRCDMRLADVIVGEGFFRLDSIGAGRIDISYRNSETSVTGEFERVILDAGQNIDFTLNNEAINIENRCQIPNS